MDTEYKKGMLVKHPKLDTWGGGVVLEDSNGATVSVSFENSGIKVLSLEYVRPVILNEALISDIEVKRLSEQNRVYFNEPFIDIYYDLKSKYPDHLIIIENGCYFDILEDDALYFQKHYQYKIYEHAIDVKGAGFPENIAPNVFNKLRESKKSFVVVSQISSINNDKVERKVSEVYSGAL